MKSVRTVDTVIQLVPRLRMHVAIHLTPIRVLDMMFKIDGHLYLSPLVQAEYNNEQRRFAMHYRARFISILRIDQFVKFTYSNFINFSTFSCTHKPAGPRITLPLLSTIGNDKMANNFL
jgi:hypothetical protein